MQTLDKDETFWCAFVECLCLRMLSNEVYIERLCVQILNSVVYLSDYSQHFLYIFFFSISFFFFIANKN